MSDASISPVITLDRVTKAFGAHRALDEVSATIHPGQFVAIIGRSGTFAFNDPNSTSGYLVPMTFFLNELSIDPKTHFSRVTFSGSHEASIYAVAHRKVEVASTNVPDMQQITREGKVARGDLRVIWVSKLIPLDPVVVRKDLPASLRQAVAESLIGMKNRAPEAFANAGSYFKGGFVPATDARYQVIREMNDAAKRLAAQK